VTTTPALLICNRSAASPSQQDVSGHWRSVSVESWQWANGPVVELSDRFDPHDGPVDGDQQEMRMVGPAACVRFVESVWRSFTHFASGAGHEVVDPPVRRVLEVVLVAAEDDADAALGPAQNGG